ncbi:MAG: hypothetical protein M3046_05180 [Actinomycetota bacterium]|nr:hypothetical protein [Actinomycetota bacterium]
MADATMVATWIAEVQSDRVRAERILSETRGAPMGADDVRTLIESVGDVTEVLADADPKLKAEVYADLGIRLTYRPAENLVSVEAAPCAAGRVGGGT